MSEVTFTPEQVKEIRERISRSRDTTHRAITQTTQALAGGETRKAEFMRLGADIQAENVTSAFPLPKVTRYRTFTHSTFTHSMDGVSGTYEMRVRDGVVEYESAMDGWVPNMLISSGDALVSSWAASLARSRNWRALAALADVAARPTEEVDP